MSDTKASLIEATVRIATAYAKANTMDLAALREVIRSTYGTLQSIQDQGVAPETPMPAVPINRSVTPNYIVCLEDGLKLKMLKRHLWTAYGLTPEAYRKKWGLPADYPMVSSNHARKRSDLAREMGLGRRDFGSSAKARNGAKK